MLRLGRITKVWHESRTADVLILDGSGPAPVLRVPVLTDPDTWNVPDVEHSGTDAGTGARELFCALAPLGIGRWAIVGFLPAAKRPSMFADGRNMTRKSNGAYVTSDKNGNMELYHPSGTFVRIGTPGHESLLGKDLDEQFDIPANTASTPTITIGLAAAGVSKGTITIKPDGGISITTEGAIDITTQGTVDITSEGAVSLTTQGAATITAEDTITLSTTSDVSVTAGTVDVTASETVTVLATTEIALTAPLITLTGTVEIVGDLTITGGLGFSGEDATITSEKMTFSGDVDVGGDLNVTGDVSSDAISLQSHVHSDVTTGTSLSGTPYTAPNT